MSDIDNKMADDPAGIAYGALAYGMWGITPLYWRLLGDVPAYQLITHRMLWCALFLVGVSLWRRRLGHIMAIARAPRLFGTLVLTSVLITINWSVFIYCVTTHQLVEASFGYYLTPLLSMALGVFLFGEHMSRQRLIGVALAVVAVGVQVIAVGHVPFMGLSLALSFGFYGFFRKKAPVDSMDGLFVETALMFPVALILVLYWMRTDPGVFPSPRLLQDVLLIGAGPVTAVPLALFAAGARRIRLTTLGFLQYLSPSITLLLAVLGFHEKFSRVDGISFVLVWLALMVVALESRLRPAHAAAERG